METPIKKPDLCITSWPLKGDGDTTVFMQRCHETARLTGFAAFWQTQQYPTPKGPVVVFNAWGRPPEVERL
jgi:hypothetical protein